MRITDQDYAKFPFISGEALNPLLIMILEPF